MGVDVVELDLSVPFTAARARNSGIRRLREHAGTIEFVHVLDGDCEMEPGWLGRALTEMASADDIAVVCGRRRERDPGASVYNFLCDVDWEAPAGDARACGGDALLRLRAIDEIGGYNPALIAGEEPEMCFRLRAKGWRIRQLADTMTWHDAAMTRFDQWWKRCVRAGHAAAEGFWLHGRSPERYNMHRCRSIVLWGAALPSAATAASVIWFPWGLAAFLVFPVQALRLFARERRARDARSAAIVAGALVIDKFAQIQGLLLFAWRRFSGREATLIEYKGDEAHGKGAISR